MWFLGVGVEQEMSAPPPKKNPGSTPVLTIHTVCGTKFLRGFVFADWRFFCFAGTNFCDKVRLKYPVPSIDNIFVFIEYVKSHNMALEYV